MTLENVLRTVLSNFGFVMFVLAAVIAVARSLAGKPLCLELLRWQLLLAAGVNGIYTAFGHIFMPEFSAQLIGWEDSPFQYEVGIADLTIGVVGVLAFWGNFGFRCATALAAAVWFGGDAIGHVQQMIVANNFAPGNAGSWFWMDVLLPITLLVCLACDWRRQKTLATEAVRT